MMMMGLFKGVKGAASVGDWWNSIHYFGGLLLGGSNVEKWGDHQKEKFFINNSVEAVNSFK